ncbi:MAG: DUF1311 domain-containing protein [Clostridium sp.]|nr:DUF1311 domain-containing protein [Clostridium sp.]
MKNKGVFTAIILIIVIGVFTTIGTQRFIAKRQTQMNTWPESAIQGSPGGGAAIEMSGAAQKDEALEMSSGDGGSALSEDSTGRSARQEQKDEEEWKTAGVADQAKEGGTAKDSAARAAGGTAEGIAPHRADGTAGNETENGMERAQPYADDMSREEVLADGYSGSSDSGIQQHAAALTSESTVMDAETEQKEGPVSPLTGVSGNGPGAPEETLSRDDYQKRLEEIDALIADMKQSELMSNTDSMSNIADYEYKLWDSERNRIYQALIQTMSGEDAEALKSEERLWLKTRDQAANQAASKYKGGTIERLEYAASLAISTRTRAYELLEEYGSCLPPHPSTK